jgi:uncharacterized membrane protein (UPF0127 family)
MKFLTSVSYLLFIFTFACTFTYASPCFSENLIPNPEFITSDGGLSPHSWYHGTSDIEGIQKSEFSLGPAGSPPLKALGIKGGEDRSGEWWCMVSGLEKGKKYLLGFKAFRERYDEGMFPEVEVFGTRVRLSNHLTYGAWQDFSLSFDAPDEIALVKFMNNTPGWFYFSSPFLVKRDALQGSSVISSHTPKLSAGQGLFPLIAYGADAEDFPLARELGFHGVVLGVNTKNVEGIVDGSRRNGLMVVADAKDNESIEMLSKAGNLLGWYVEDEPEGRSVPPEEIQKRVTKVRAAGSPHPAFMAMVRPEFVRVYKDAADIILMDQYPIPHLPIIWLSKSMDEAKRSADGKAIWAVIQIFGGPAWKGTGWDRVPSYEEMKALSYLAIVHGAKGLFFFTISDKNYAADGRQREDLKRLLQELRYLGPWYLGEKTGPIDFSPDPLYEYAPDGTRPVHAVMLGYGKQSLLIAVNVLDKEVKGRLSVPENNLRYLDEFFTGKRYVVKYGNITDEFRPYEVKVYISDKHFRKIRIREGKGDAVRGEWYAEVAETEEERRIGLMFRGLPSDDRALLLQDQRGTDIQIHTFNMRVPLDLVFLDDESRVAALHKDAPPCDQEKSCILYRSPRPSRAVIEFRAGVIEKSGLREGDRIEFY